MAKKIPLTRAVVCGIISSSSSFSAAEKLISLENEGHKFADDEARSIAREFVRYTFVQLLREEGYNAGAEYKFHPKRKWKIDYFIEINGKLIGLEVEGGVWISGRHSRGSGFVKDMEKYNEAARMGILIIRVQPIQLFSNYLMELLHDIASIS